MWKRLASYVVFASYATIVSTQQLVLSDTGGDTSAVTDSGYPPLINSGVHALVRSVMRQAHIPGLGLGVVRLDGDVELASWGISSESGDRMRLDTVYQIASCSKAFLSATVGILIDDFAQGRNQTTLPPGVHMLDWNTKLIDLLPDDWKLMDEWASEKATLRDVLSHQSGLPRHEFSYKTTDTPLDVIHRMRYLRPAFELRQRYHYNNQMYILGSYLVSMYAGVPYTEYIQARIFDPLDMTATTFSPVKAMQSGKLTQTWLGSNSRRIPFWFSEDMVELNAGPGGILTTVSDMTKWIRMLLNEGIHPTTNVTIIPHSAFEMVTTVHTIMQGRAAQPYFSIDGYGMGWHRKSYQGHEITTHSGGDPGFSAEVFLLPSDGLGIVALANADEKNGDEDAVIYRIIEDYLKLPRNESERLARVRSESHSPTSPATTASISSSTPQLHDPPTLPLAAYAGHYFDLGYGSLVLCAPTPMPMPECTSVLNALAPFHPVFNASTPELYAATPSVVWTSHFRFVHIHSDVFELRGTFVFPRGFGRDTTPFQSDDGGANGGGVVTAKFVVEGGRVKGLAVSGLVGERTQRVREGGSEEEVAEIWFERR